MANGPNCRNDLHPMPYDLSCKTVWRRVGAIVQPPQARPAARHGAVSPNEFRLRAITKSFVLSILCLSFTACAPTVPVLVVRPPPSAVPQTTPPVDITNAVAVTPRDGAGAIVITRDKGSAGKECTYDISLDDQHVAGLRTRGQVTLYADPGERIVGVSVRSDGSCASASEQVAVPVVAHATTKVRVGADGSFDLIIDLNTYGGSLPP